MSTKEKSPCQTVNIEKKSVLGEDLKTIFSVPLKSIKKSTARGLRPDQTYVAKCLLWNASSKIIVNMYLYGETVSCSIMPCGVAWCCAANFPYYTTPHHIGVVLRSYWHCNRSSLILHEYLSSCLTVGWLFLKNDLWDVAVISSVECVMAIVIIIIIILLFIDFYCA